MKNKMIKVLWIFLIFALTSNTKGFASAMDHSLSIASFPISDCHSVPDAESRLQNIEYYTPTQNISCVIPLQIRGTKGRYDYSVIPTNTGIQSDSPLTRGAVCVPPIPLTRGKKGGYAFSVIPVQTGIQSSFLPDLGTLKIKTFHPTKKLPPSGSAIADTGSSSLTLNCISVNSIQPFQVYSNNISDIFIPPKITI